MLKLWYSYFGSGEFFPTTITIFNRIIGSFFLACCFYYIFGFICFFMSKFIYFYTRNSSSLLTANLAVKFNISCSVFVASSGNINNFRIFAIFTKLVDFC